MNPNQSIILFDGVCNFCDNTIQFVLKHDVNAYFRFASLQSDVGQQLLKQFQLPTNQFDSFVLIEAGQVYQKSTAALRVVRHLDGYWSKLWHLYWIPQGIRDVVYDVIARNRYRIFGKKEVCMMPTKELRARFLN